MTTTKALDKASLPAAPTIPVSNASYAKIIGRIQSAAMHGTVAVEHIKHTVKGTNTYAKICRRYADDVISALSVTAAAPPPAPTETTGKVPTPKAARKPRAKKAVAA